jgi:hypothetical protein
MYKSLFIALLLFTSFLSGAQEVIATQGDYFSNANGSISFTIGEVVIETITNGSNSITQGFNNQSELVVLGVDDIENEFQALVFPNPVSDILQLNISDFTGLNYSVYDLRGRLISSNNILESKTTINLTKYSNGIYLLMLLNENKQKLKTYRIIKN